MLELMEKTKTEIVVKEVCKQPRKCSVQEMLEDEEDEVLKNEDNNSNSGCIVLRPCK